MPQVSVIHRAERVSAQFDEPFAYAGIDEVGVGSIAGPMMAAVVVLPSRHSISRLPIDSKRLSPNTIQKMAALIEDHAVFAWVGSLDAAAVDALGVREALTLLWQAAVVAVRAVLPAILVIVDGGEAIPEVNNQRAIPQADDSYDAVSAAAILAKACCDRVMTELDARHAGYGLAKHKGYSTKEHLLTVRRLGLSPAHRRCITEKALRKGVPVEECDLSLETLRAMLCEVVPLLDVHPEIGDEWSTKFLREQYTRVVQRGAAPSARQQFFIVKSHGQIMKIALKRGFVAAPDRDPH